MTWSAIDKESENRSGILVRLLFGVSFFLLSNLLHADDTSGLELSQQLDEFLNSLDTRQNNGSTFESTLISDSITVSHCSQYPYHADSPGVELLVKDLSEGIQKGVACLTGKSEQGMLHVFHQQKARQLLAILNSDQPKSLECVSDELFAYAMAVSPQQHVSSAEIQRKINLSPRLTIFLDTFRIGGLLSKRFDVKTYQEFFKLSKGQITEHLTSKPLRMKGLHRYRNLPGLLFHETIHWLGTTHTNQGPDLTFLYETCCFGGSEYISNASVNAGFQQAACNILKDDDLWSANPEQQKKVWKEKGYRKLKTTMRQFY